MVEEIPRFIEGRQGVMSRKKLILIIFLAILFFSVVIPIAINESYKHGVIYVTKWDAADVLSFYGAVLGSVATVGALIATISFTQIQISREAFLKNENEKWLTIETVLADALNSINPLLPLIGTMDTGLTDPSVAIAKFQKYQISCKIATDQLNTCLSIADYPKVKPILDAINSFVGEIDPILQEGIKEYSKLRDFNGKDNAKKTLEVEDRFPGSFSKEEIVLAKRILKDTNKVQRSDIQKAIIQFNEKMVSIYGNIYRPLLQLKGSTFEAINTEVQKNADNILHRWGRL